MVIPLQQVFKSNQSTRLEFGLHRHTMPRPEPSLTSASPTELASAELADQDFSFDDLRIRKPPPEWTTTAIVSCVVAWGALAVHNLIAMPKLDGVPPVSFDRVANSRKGVPRYV